MLILIKSHSNTIKFCLISLNIEAEMTENEEEMSLILVNDWYNLFLFAVHEWSLKRFSKKISSR